jgi:hypothetical protein
LAYPGIDNFHRNNRSLPVAVQSSKSDLLTEFLQELLPADAKLLQLVPKSLRKSVRWGAIGAGAALLLTWNGRLVAATGAGLGTMWLAYSLRDAGWRAAITEVVNALEGVDRRITLSILAGAGATVGTYTALSIALESQNHWLATGMILQGTMTLGAIGVLLWQKLQPSPQKSGLLQYIQDLTDADPLKRLIAVRQINQMFKQHPAQQAEIMEFYQVLLTREPDRLVQTALMDGLQTMTTQSSFAAARSTTFQPSRRRAPVQVGQRAAIDEDELLLPIEWSASNAAPVAKARAESFEHSSTIG